MSTFGDKCNRDVLDASSDVLTVRVFRTDALLVLSLIIVAILVGVGSFTRQYRHHGSIRLLSLGAYTLFLPLVSYVVSGVDKENCALPDGIKCSDNSSKYLLAWPSLVQIIGANCCTGIAADDEEGRSIGPAVQLLVGAIWTLLLVLKHFGGYQYDSYLVYWFIAMPCALNITKVMSKLYAYKKARHSLEVGRNPRLIAGYMEQLNSQRGEEHVIPLLLMGEDKQRVEEGPRGYRFTDSSGNSSLVTMDNVVKMASTNDTVLNSWPPYQDLCFSFSLFKLLRQRFTGRSGVEADYPRVPSFMTKLQHGDPQGIVSMIHNELSFACDFYYSYLPISYSRGWLPILNVVLSFFVVTYCSVSGIFLLRDAYVSPGTHQITCKLTCGEEYDFADGHILTLDVLISFLAIVVLLSEAWEIISYACSNWTKVNLICYYITKTSRQGSPLMKTLIRCMLRLRCKVLNHSYKMGQTSIMDTNMKIVKAVRRLLRLSDQQMEFVEIPPEVNTAILAKFRDSNWSLPTVTASLQQSSIGNILLYGNGKGTSDVILVWHIATCIFEIKHPHEPSNAPAVTATRLSRYCAYLLSSAPELLPDDKAWSKNIYKSVKKIAEPIFRKSNKGPIGYEDILQKLKEKSNDNTELKNGVALGKQLVDETRDAEQEGWEILAGFWSAMVLYIAPSDNVGAHREAIARGGELITILWAMLTHAGIISRPRTGHAV